MRIQALSATPSPGRDVEGLVDTDAALGRAEDIAFKLQDENMALLEANRALKAAVHATAADNKALVEVLAKNKKELVRAKAGTARRGCPGLPRRSADLPICLLLPPVPPLPPIVHRRRRRKQRPPRRPRPHPLAPCRHPSAGFTACQRPL